MNVTVKRHQLKDRARTMEARLQHFEDTAARQNGTLKRHETWRHEYASFPYLLGAPDDRLCSRFKDVFINQTELNSDAKIGPLPIGEEHDFMPKFTHLLEEYGLRTGGHPPSEVIAAARAPAVKYFENGEPIATKIFQGYAAPTTPFTVKYGRREFLEPMLRTGRLRICPASYYNDVSHNAAVKDDEIHRTFFIPTFRERLKGIHHMVFQGHRIEYGDDDIVVPVEAPDYFLLSLCDSIYYRMPTDFDADAALIIREPTKFAQRVISAFLARYSDWKPHYGPVTYYDPYRDYTKMRVHQMSKHFGYAYQREVRIVMEALRTPRQTLQPEFFDIGPMGDYAELLLA
ncbi:hypothetical protein [Nitratireductor sp. XY-223]|uniref:hypothetical protein n=1 Tax=Nitratireductor sp. XY-223 TaxID=2561926 RepID=UPI0010A9CD27|nr:hypothetical protein [Nitratireductor sp. XY-223]